MWYFFGGILLLIFGYYSYGALIEKIIGKTEEPTPAIKHPDGVDYLVLPHWKNMLIQLLNIAGIGPVIGVILGIKFGIIVFMIIPIGNIIGGAAHDFIAGMMSLREDGDNLPNLIAKNLGRPFSKIFTIFMTLMLLLVVAVFINVPAELLDDLLAGNWFWAMAVLIFLYYIAATLFPIDQIIGRFYPFFGLLLLLGTAAIFIALSLAVFQNPALLEESAGFQNNQWSAPRQPIIPCLFVTIACGIISGFHATQSPIVARTMSSPTQSRAVFYGMMIVEGIIAMIWAAAALAIYNLHPEFMKLPGATVLQKITDYFLGTGFGTITVLSVVILAITSGDTAMRSLRLSLAEVVRLEQKPLKNRLFICIPLILLTAGLLAWSNKNAESFNLLWQYFAWANQVLAATTLFAGTVWLYRSGKNYFIAAIPGVFMAFIVITFILWASPLGFGLPYDAACYFGGTLSLLLLCALMAHIQTEKKSPREMCRKEF